VDCSVYRYVIQEPDLDEGTRSVRALAALRRSPAEVRLYPAVFHAGNGASSSCLHRPPTLEVTPLLSPTLGGGAGSCCIILPRGGGDSSAVTLAGGQPGELQHHPPTLGGVIVPFQTSKAGHHPTAVLPR